MRDPSLPSPTRNRRKLRWALLALVGLGYVASASASCSAGFDPPGKLNTLRILSVEADKPYANPGDTVTFKMNLTDRLDPTAQRPVQIVWIGGCFDPVGDQYFGCYEQLASELSLLSSGEPPPPGTIAAGIGLDTFQLPIPEDIVTRRPPPAAGPYAGTAFVFFLACAGNVRPIPAEGTSIAGSFPIGCFDDAGRRLGPESTVAGYTQIFSFDDGRANANPTIDSLDIEDEPISDDVAQAPHVKACNVAAEDRRQAGCAAQDPFANCTTYSLRVTVPEDVGEIDPEGLGPNSEPLHEGVWVSYFADGGDFDSDTKLVSDPTEGYEDKQDVNWVPPSEPGAVDLWAVLRDSRGGSTTIRRTVIVDP
jgi:hypothetical protein